MDGSKFGPYVNGPKSGPVPTHEHSSETIAIKKADVSQLWNSKLWPKTIISAHRELKPPSLPPAACNNTFFLQQKEQWHVNTSVCMMRVWERTTNSRVYTLQSEEHQVLELVILHPKCQKILSRAGICVLQIRTEKLRTSTQGEIIEND